MSITTVSETSIDSFNQGQGFENDIDRVEKIVKARKRLVGADILEELAKEKSVGPKPFIGNCASARMRDCQAKRGSIRKTGEKEIAQSTGKKGDVWEYVPEGRARLVAQKEFWVESLARHTAEAKKTEEVLERDRNHIAAFDFLLLED